jgi:hypothetical protein
MNYGMEMTDSRKLVIYGGQTDDSTECAFRNRYLTRYNDLWMIDFSSDNPDFMLIDWITTPGGFSKILKLSDELLCIMNPNFENQMKMLDMKQMRSYDVAVQDLPEDLVRTGFGIAGKNGADFIIYGGFQQKHNGIEKLSSLNILYQLSFINAQLEVSHYSGSQIAGFVSGLFISLAVFIIFYYKLQSRKIAEQLKKNNIQKKLLEESATALENSKKSFEDRIKHGINDDLDTRTLVLPRLSNLSIPAYKMAKFGCDFSTDKLLAKGGMGEVFLGNIFNSDIRQTYNNNEQICIIKLPLINMAEVDFIQELCIHEVFKDIKYFAKLICFSLNPQAIALKYYQLGSLFDFIFTKGHLKEYTYSFNLVLDLSIKLTWAFHLMHSKGYIHHDIKPANILLDHDKEESLYPVITDFGIVQITGAASVVTGMKIKNARGATPTYTSPENIADLKNKRSFEITEKSDVFSIGIILLEMFTRHNAWEKKTFVSDKLLEGLRPEIKFPKMEENCANILKQLISNCWIENPQSRPSMEEISRTLRDLREDIKKSK